MNNIKEMKFRLALELFKNGHFEIVPNSDYVDIRVCGGIDLCRFCYSINLCKTIEKSITDIEYRNGSLEPDELSEFFETYPEIKLVQ